jgi:hypothetical protein
LDTANIAQIASRRQGTIFVVGFPLGFLKGGGR